MDATPDPRLVALYSRAMICKAFPAYKLHELAQVPAGELLRALELLSLAEQARAPAQE